MKNEYFHGFLSQYFEFRNPVTPFQKMTSPSTVLFLLLFLNSVHTDGKKARVYLFKTQEAYLFAESPLYLSSASSVPEVSTFIPFAECSIGL